MVNPTSGAVNTVTIGSGYNRITGLTAGPDGNMWGTVLQQTSTSAHVAVVLISPNGVVIPFTSGISSTDGLGQIVTGPDGNLWFTEGPNKRIGRMNPSTYSITEYTTPFEPGRLTADPSGYVWMYSNLSGSGFTTEFGRISTSNFSIPTYNFGYDVYDIAIGPDGADWYAETTNVAVPTVTKWFPGGTSATYQVQYAGGGLTFAADGGLWVLESTGSQGQENAQRLNPATGAVTDTCRQPSTQTRCRAGTVTSISSNCVTVSLPSSLSTLIEGRSRYTPCGNVRFNTPSAPAVADEVGSPYAASMFTA